MTDRPYICVFCGSSPGHRPEYAEAAERLGLALAHKGLGLVYGGGRVGLMGKVADAVLTAGGHTIGVIPEPLMQKEIAHSGLSELIVVPGMHERKATMARLSSGFITLPGGVGTFEEFFEILTWAVLGLHNKPLGLLNIDGYFDPLLALLDHGVTEGFIRPIHLGLLLVSSEPEAIVSDLLAHKPPPPGPLWIEPDQT
jgi:uncharacterized protein (TIGR00730 family)